MLNLFHFYIFSLQTWA